VSRARFAVRVHAADARDARSPGRVPRPASLRVDLPPVAIGRADLQLGTSLLASGFFEPNRVSEDHQRRPMRPIAMATSSGIASGAHDQRALGDAPPIVSAEEFHKRAAANVHARAKDAHAAFYSSWTDCITTDPAAMVLPMDDHMAHRGHGVFDTAHLHAGHLHMLDRHIERFFKSMAAANIPPPLDESTAKSLILRVAAAGGLREGQLRFYASAGPGGFALDQAECVKSQFYCVAVKKRTNTNDATDSSKPRGVAVVTSSVPVKPPYFATVKSTNYLPNALVVADAKRRGAQYGIWLTSDGKHVAEGPSMNVGFVVRASEEADDVSSDVFEKTEDEKRTTRAEKETAFAFRDAALGRSVGGVHRRARGGVGERGPVRTRRFVWAGGGRARFRGRREKRGRAHAHRFGHKLRAHRLVGRRKTSARSKAPSAPSRSRCGTPSRRTSTKTKKSSLACRTSCSRPGKNSDQHD
jgi:hypothetical protein